MGYSVKGGKLGKREKRGDWHRLFDTPFPAAMLSRPSRRPFSSLEAVACVEATIKEQAAGPEPTLCFDVTCNNEILTTPATVMLARTGDSAQAVTGAFCAQCAMHSDGELFGVIGRQLRRMGFGPAIGDGHAFAPTEVAADFLEVEGVKIAVAADADQQPGRSIALKLADLLAEGQLARTMTFRLGTHNCHGLAWELHHDLKALGPEHWFAGRFEYRRGSSALLKSSADPDGLHSWIECDGWAIDASGGAQGNPIMIERTAAYYERLRLTAVRRLDSETSCDAVT
jgi:hypothetical protein